MDRTVSVSELRKNIKKEMDRVCDNHEVLVTTRQHGKNVVLISEEDYQSLYETAYLLGSENNRRRLQEAIHGEGVLYNSIEELESRLGL